MNCNYIVKVLLLPRSVVNVAYLLIEGASLTKTCGHILVISCSFSLSWLGFHEEDFLRRTAVISLKLCEAKESRVKIISGASVWLYPQLTQWAALEPCIALLPHQLIYRQHKLQAPSNIPLSNVQSLLCSVLTISLLMPSVFLHSENSYHNTIAII